MAVTSVSYTGNGNTAAFNISFDYQDTSDVKVTVDNTPSTAFTVLGSTLTFNSVPANGAAIRIFRDTYDTNLRAIFQSGSAIRAEDLNKDNTQLLYLTQESNNTAADALTTAETANTTANAANTTANTANATANAANTTANQALNTANASISITKNVTAYNPFQTVANLPSPSDGYYASVADSTGIENLVNLSGLPNGFVGSSDLSVRLVGDGTQWLFIDYYANDPDNRYQQIIADDNAYTNAEKTKLAGIESGATADQTAAEIRTLVDAASDSNVFTDADHTKLDGIEAGATGDQTAAEIRSLVNAASDSNVFTDADHSKLDGIEANATQDQTAAEIRTLVGSASNSNVFTDADHTKLDGIETAATADQTAAEIRTLVESASDSNVFTNADHTKLNGIEAGATADQTKADIDALNIDADTLDGQHGSYYRNAGNLNAGTISDARLPATISSNITGSSASCTGNAVTATTSTNCSRSISSGNGLTGGGALTANRTLTVQAANNTINVASGGISVAGGNVTAGNATNCSRSVGAGNGLTGGGALTANRTLNVGQGSGITVTSDAVAVDSTVIRTTFNQTKSGTMTFNDVVNIRGNIDLADNDILRFGSGDDAEFFVNGSHFYLDLNAGIGNFYIRDGTTTRYAFDDNGTLSLVNCHASERIQAGNGTQSHAAFKFNNDTDTGIYRKGTNNIAIITGANQRHSINSSGQQIFSAQGAPTRAHIFKTAQGSSTNRYIISGYRSSSRADQADGAEVFRVRTTGGVQNTANQYTSLSDERLKENIVDAQSQWDDVKALRLVNFNFIENVGFGPEKLLGFIAQEVEQICPQLVDSDDIDDEETMVPGQKSVRNSIIMTKAFGALQEAMARIEQLEARIAQLETP